MSPADKKPGTLVIALVAALVAALAVAGWQALERRDSSSDLKEARSRVQTLSAEGEVGKDALEAAKSVLLEITTYSWKDGEHEFAWVDRIEGAELKQQLAPNVPKLQAAIVDGKVTAQGQVVDAVPRVVDKSQVEVLAFVDQAITDETSKDVKIEEQRVSMTLKLVDGKWLVDRLELLSGTNNTPAP